jgi:hypothetical protein
MIMRYSHSSLVYLVLNLFCIIFLQSIYSCDSRHNNVVNTTPYKQEVKIVSPEIIEITYLKQTLQSGPGEEHEVGVKNRPHDKDNAPQVLFAWGIDGYWKTIFLKSSKSIEGFMSFFNYIKSFDAPTCKDFKPMGAIIFHYHELKNDTFNFDGSYLKINNYFHPDRIVGITDMISNIVLGINSGDSCITIGSLKHYPNSWFIYPGSMCDKPADAQDNFQVSFPYFVSKGIFEGKDSASIKRYTSLFELSINKDGKVNQTRTIYSTDSTIDIKCIKVFSTMIIWRPAVLKGTKVNSTINLHFNKDEVEIE